MDHPSTPDEPRDPIIVVERFRAFCDDCRECIPAPARAGRAQAERDYVAHRSRVHGEDLRSTATRGRSLGGRRAAERMTPAERSARARKAALALWAKRATESAS
jgi:hypothetical protein